MNKCADLFFAACHLETHHTAEAALLSFGDTVSGMALKARIVNLGYLIMFIENVSDDACTFFMLLDPRM